MKLLVLYETNKESREIKQKDVVWLFWWPRRVFINGIANSLYPVRHAHLKGSDTGCSHYSKCGCAICARSGYQREERRGAWVEPTSDRRYRIWGGGQGTKLDREWSWLQEGQRVQRPKINLWRLGLAATNTIGQELFYQRLKTWSLCIPSQPTLYADSISPAQGRHSIMTGATSEAAVWRTRPIQHYRRLLQGVAGRPY